MQKLRVPNPTLAGKPCRLADGNHLSESDAGLFPWKIVSDSFTVCVERICTKNGMALTHENRFEPSYSWVSYVPTLRLLGKGYLLDSLE